MVTIGLVGHVDAGKSTLVKTLTSLTYVDREVGCITQDVKCVPLDKALLDRLCGTEGDSVLLVDVPGHTAFGTSRAISVAVADVVAVVIQLGRRVPSETLELIKTLETLPFCIIFTKHDLFKDPKWVKQGVEDLLLAGFLVEHYTNRKEGRPYFLAGIGESQQVLNFLRFCRKIRNLGKKFMYLESVLTSGRTLGIFFSRGYSTEEVVANGHVVFKKFFGQPYGHPRPLKVIEDGLWGAKFEGRLEPGTQLNLARETKRVDGLVVKSSSEARLAAIISVLKKERISVMYASVGPVTKNDIECAKSAGACNRIVIGFNVKTLKHPFVVDGVLIHQIIQKVKKIRTECLRQKILEQFGPNPVTCLRPVPNALFFQDTQTLIAGFEVVKGSLQVGMKFAHGSITSEVISIQMDGKKVFKATSFSRGAKGNRPGVGVCFKPFIPHQCLYEKSLGAVFASVTKHMLDLTLPQLVQLLME